MPGPRLRQDLSLTITATRQARRALAGKSGDALTYADRADKWPRILDSELTAPYGYQPNDW